MEKETHQTTRNEQKGGSMRHPLADEIATKYQEHIEMSDDPKTMLINILASLLEDSRGYNEFLKKRLDGYRQIYAQTRN
jgi:hypothetical protein